MRIEQGSPTAPADAHAGARPDAVGALYEAIGALDRARASSDAMEAVLLAGLVEESGAVTASGDEADMRLRAVAAELAAQRRVSDRTVQRRLSEAYTLVHAFPAVHQSLATGAITKAHATAIVDAGLSLNDDARDTFVVRALELAQAESPNRLRAMLGAVAEAVQPVGITERHRRARQARSVWVTDDCDGMATLHAHLPAVLAHAAVDRITQYARATRAVFRSPDEREASGAARGELKLQPDSDGIGTATGPRFTAALSDADAPGDFGAAPTSTAPDTRTLDQVRADVLADLLLSAAPATTPTGLDAVQARVAVTIPVHALAGDTDAGALLDGSGPLDASTARHLAGIAAAWDRVFTHPSTGAVLTVDTYRPNADLKRTLRIRHGRCRFPACRQPAVTCDIDHSTAWTDGGATCECNLAHLCRRHHTLKHAANWTVRHVGAGLIEWTSPRGQVYTDAPTIPIAFQPGAGHQHVGTADDGAGAASADPPDPLLRSPRPPF